MTVCTRVVSDKLWSLIPWAVTKDVDENTERKHERKHDRTSPEPVPRISPRISLPEIDSVFTVNVLQKQMMSLGLSNQAVKSFLSSRRPEHLQRKAALYWATILIEENWNNLPNSSEHVTINAVRHLGLTHQNARDACRLARHHGVLNRYSGRYWATNWCQYLAAKGKNLTAQWNLTPTGTAKLGGKECTYARVTYPLSPKDDAAAKVQAAVDEHFPLVNGHRRLYHGTTLQIVEKILTNGVVRRSKDECDFGAGHYCYEDVLFACAWGQSRGLDSAAVLIFDVPWADDEEKSCLKFGDPEHTPAWAHLVHACRTKDGVDVNAEPFLKPFADRFQNSLLWVEGPVCANAGRVESGKEVARPKMDEVQVVAVNEQYVRGMVKFVKGVIVVDPNPKVPPQSNKNTDSGTKTKGKRKGKKKRKK